MSRKPENPPGPKPEQPDDAPEDRARRRLLRMAVYVPPVVLGSIAVTLSSCQAGSCGPTNCNPMTCPPANCDPGQCPPVVCNPANKNKLPGGNLPM